ncbi:biotin/lipoyl-containing protein [Rathayibacter sp. CAU 1779]
MTAASPGVTRRWVFPILRILIFAAIAAALVKLAFFSGATAGSDDLRATGVVSDPTSIVRTGSISDDLTVKGTVFADAAVPVRATATGEITAVSIAVGQHVDSGAAVIVVKKADDQTHVTVVAPAVGTVSDLTALVGQQVGVGDVLAQVAPPTFNVTGSIAAADQYRLLSNPTTAQVVISGGPAPFTCTGLTVSAPLAGASSTPSTSGQGTEPSSGTASGPTVRCSVPADVTVFAGLAAKLTIAAGKADHALIVPATAVEGISGGEGTVYTRSGSGDPTPHKVQLGIFDGTSVQIVSGLKKGDEILQYVPSKSDEQTDAVVGVRG